MAVRERTPNDGTKMHTIETPRARIRSALAALLLPLALGGCDSLLDVDNPQIVQDDDISAEMVPVLVHGIMARFQRTYGDLALYTAMFTDELIDGHTYQPHRPWDMRDLDAGGQTGGRYAVAHALRGDADTLGARIQELLGDSATRSLPLARARAYGGYAYTFLGEYFCHSPINARPLAAKAPHTPNELLGIGIERFDEAISIANAARNADNAASADTIAALANIGAARAALQRGDGPAAVAHAEAALALDPDFAFWVAYSTNSGGEDNVFHSTTTTYDSTVTGSRWAGVDPAFAGLDDLRIPHTPNPMVLMDTRFFHAPYQPSSFSGWESGVNVEFERDMAIRLASALEARYIIEEVNGPTLEFLNERRAAGGQPALAALPPDPLAELRDQRRRDFYLDGHRLGDLRRWGPESWTNQPGTPYPGSSTGDVYEADTCIPTSLAERNSNMWDGEWSDGQEVGS